MNEESLFQEALSRSPEERTDFLDRACEGRPEMREAVAALLAAHEKTGNILDRPQGDLADQPRPDATLGLTAESGQVNAAGEHISDPIGAPPEVAATDEFRTKTGPEVVIAGRYTLVEKIGEGGMGEVWVAKQSEPVKRKVALKLIKPGMDSRVVLARFEQERQALALMEHPNIARVIDGGITAERTPYFVMELVNGLPLTKFCDEARMGVRERLELFASICNAVQHAHQKGIIHRDLKPTNILVTIIDGKPVPKVIDFGVAKATSGKLTDESLSTQFGAIVGTLEYMSPEQAGFSGEDIDTRADIYSLGVILYELLTGLRPIDAKRLKKAALTEMIRIIKEEDPSKPSTRLSTEESAPSMAALRHTEPKKLSALLRGELDWVVMKCLEKRRDRRYETANGLARDVQRYLANEVVEARPPSTGYRLRKFASQHRAALATVGAFALLLVVATIVSAGLALWANHEREKAEKAVVRAEKSEEQAIDAVKRFRDAIVNEPELKKTRALEGLRRRLLKEPLDFFRALRDRLQADRDTRPESLDRLAGASFDLGFLTDEIGDKQDALIAYRESLAIGQRLADTNPTDTKFQSNLATTHHNIGVLLRDTGKPAQAIEGFESAIAILRTLADANPTITEFQQKLANNHDDIGQLLRDTGKPAQALEAYESAIAILRKLADANPTDTNFQRNLAHSHVGIGNQLLVIGRLSEARKAYESAIAILRELADANPTNTDFQQNLAAAYLSIGNQMRDTGKPAEAIESYGSALAIFQKLADADPSVTQFQRNLAASHGNMGTLLWETRRPAEALEAHARALVIFQKLVDANPTVTYFRRNLATSHLNIGTVLREIGKPTEAMKSFESSLSILQRLADTNPTDTEFQRNLMSGYQSIGGLLGDTGKLLEARDAFNRALAIGQKLTREHPELTHCASGLGAVLNDMALIDLRENRFEEARVPLRQAINWQRKALAGNPANPTYRQFLRNHFTNLIKAARGLGDTEGVAEAERELATLRDSDPAMQALDARLAAILRGDQTPKDNPERLGLAQRAYDKTLHAAAARLWAEALRSDPKVAEDRQAQTRYNAACAASLAGCGQGKDDPSPDASSKEKLRSQAREWLEAELDAWTKLLESSPPQARPFIGQTLEHWKQDGDLAGIREAKSLEAWPEAERGAWRDLWAKVDALLARGQTTPTPVVEPRLPR